MDKEFGTDREVSFYLYLNKTKDRKTRLQNDKKRVEIRKEEFLFHRIRKTQL